MKTYFQFQEDAVKWNSGRLAGSGMSPSDTAKTKLTILRRKAKGNPTPEIFKQIKNLEQGISTTSANNFDDVDPEKENRKIKTSSAKPNTGRAKTQAISPVGTVPNVRRSGLHKLVKRPDGTKEWVSVDAKVNPGDEIVSGRYGTVPGGRGTNRSRSGGRLGGR